MHESEKRKWSRSIVSDSQRPHGLQPTSLLHPWDFPSKSTWGFHKCQSLSYTKNSLAFPLYSLCSFKFIRWCTFQLSVEEREGKSKHTRTGSDVLNKNLFQELLVLIQSLNESWVSMVPGEWKGNGALGEHSTLFWLCRNKRRESTFSKHLGGRNIGT